MRSRRSRKLSHTQTSVPCGTLNDNEEYESSEDVSTESSTDSTSFNNLPCRESGFIHMLQVVVKDRLKDKGYLNTVMGKSSSIVDYARKSTLAA